MKKEGISAEGLLARMDQLRKRRPGGTLEPVTEFCERCGLDASAWSRWRQEGSGVSIYSLQRVYEANKDRLPWLTLDWLVYGTSKDVAPYQLVERMASDVMDAVNRSLELVPGRGVVEMVRREPPEPDDPGPA